MHENNQQLEAYINEQLKAGHSPEALRGVLIQHGWDAVAVDKALTHLHVGRALPSSPAAAPQGSGQQISTGQKYNLFTAIIDAFRAIKSNSAAFGLSLLVVAGVAAITNIALGALIFGMFLSNGLIGFGGLAKNIFIGVMFMIFMLVYYGFLYAFMSNMLSLPIYSGRHDRTLSIGQIISQTLKKLLKVMIITGLVYVIATIPIILMVLVSLVSMVTGQTSVFGSLLFMAIFSLASFVWIIIAMLRYSLAPLVGLYEDVSVVGAIKRSRYLLNKGGQWFLVKGIFLFLLALIIFAIISGNTLQDIQNATSVIATIFLIGTEVIVSSVLVMLYVNRVRVKG